MRARERVWAKCRVRVRDRVRCRLRIRVRVMGRVRSQEAPGTDPTAEMLDPRRAEWRAPWRVPVGISFWVTRPDNSMRCSSRSPQKSSVVAAVRLGRRHGDVPFSRQSISAPVLEPFCVLFSDVGIGSLWGESLS